MTITDAHLDDDPFLAAWVRTRRPPLAPQHLLNARLQHAAAVHELDQLDAELEVLCARRRGVLERLRGLRTRLWLTPPGPHRRRGPIGTPPLPPAPPGATPLWGRDLRLTVLAILHRHGTCSLRELHGLLHRYGYTIDSDRPVQRLSDALSYEVEERRCERVERGVYRALGERPHVGLADQPLPWSDPDGGEPRPDAAVADDPERWSGNRWPTSGLDPDAPARALDDPPDGEDLDAVVRLARHRCADLLRVAVAKKAKAREGDRANPSTDLFVERWRRFAVESVPEAQKWLSKAERWPWNGTSRRAGGGPPPTEHEDGATSDGERGGDPSG